MKLTWRKSSHSSGNGGDCVELAAPRAGLRLVRDSKNPDGPRIAVSNKQLGKLLDSVKAGEYNL